MSGGWVKVGVDHTCVPDDWRTYPKDSVYRCPTCGRAWRVHGSVGGPARSMEPDPFALPFALSSNALIVLGGIALALLFVALIAGVA